MQFQGKHFKFQHFAWQHLMWCIMSDASLEIPAVQKPFFGDCWSFDISVQASLWGINYTHWKHCFRGFRTASLPDSIISTYCLIHKGLQWVPVYGSRDRFFLRGKSIHPWGVSFWLDICRLSFKKRKKDFGHKLIIFRSICRVHLVFT